MKKILGVLILLSLTFFLAESSAQRKKRAFKGGEKLRYVAEYKIGMFNVDVALIDFTVTEEERYGKQSYKVNALAQILPKYRYFFDMRDDYYVWLERDNLRPLYFENFIKEGSYTLESHYIYDWDKMVVNTYENRPVWDAPKRREIGLLPNSLDALSLFYNLRCIPIEDMKVGKADTLEIVFANRIRRVEYRLIGREHKKIKGLGKLATIHFRCQLANNDGISFEDGSEFDLWLSDDHNRIPLYVETPIKVGSVRARLVDYKGLIKPLK